jgi:hypothetical protein
VTAPRRFMRMDLLLLSNIVSSGYFAPGTPKQ